MTSDVITTKDIPSTWFAWERLSDTVHHLTLTETQLVGNQLCYLISQRIL